MLLMSPPSHQCPSHGAFHEYRKKRRHANTLVLWKAAGVCAPASLRVAESRLRNSKSRLLGQEQVLQDMWQHCRALLHKREVFTFPFSVATPCLFYFSALASPFDKQVTEGLPWQSEHWKTVQILCYWTRICFCSQNSCWDVLEKARASSGEILAICCLWVKLRGNALSALEVPKGVRVTVPLTRCLPKRQGGREKE